MRFILFLVMSVQGDVDTSRIDFVDRNQCEKAKSEIEEGLKKSPDIALHGAFCLEVRY